MTAKENINSGAIDRAIFEQAAHWHAVMFSGEVTKEEAIACDRWRNASDKNEAAFQQVNVIFGRINGLSHHSRSAASTVLNDVLTEDRKQNRPLMRGALLMLPFAIFCAFQLQLFSLDRFNSDHFTEKGGRKSIELVDGSILILNTNSAITIDYSSDQRVIQLQRGEIWVDVAADRNRPFVVETEFGTAKALGTQYAVSLKPTEMDVVVTESLVKVCGFEPSAAEVSGTWCVDTSEGYRTRVEDGNVSGPEAVDKDVLTAWLQGRLVVNNWPLANVLDELKRYQPGVIHYNRNQISKIKVSGVFPLDDPHQALSILSKNLPIQIKSYTRFVTLVGLDQ